jgi:hypothetical protein
MEKQDGKQKYEYREKDNIEVYLNIYKMRMQIGFNWFR